MIQINKDSGYMLEQGYIGSILIIIVLLIFFLLNKKAIMLLPCFAMIIITPIYNMLDKKYFVKLLGTPASTPWVYNSFSANTLRWTVYDFLVVIMFIIAIYLSKKIKNERNRKVYLAAVLFLNIVLEYVICKQWMYR